MPLPSSRQRLPAPAVRQEAIRLQGGLYYENTDSSMPQGACREALNFIARPGSGYERCEGSLHVALTGTTPSFIATLPTGAGSTARAVEEDAQTQLRAQNATWQAAYNALTISNGGLLSAECGYLHAVASLDQVPYIIYAGRVLGLKTSQVTGSNQPVDIIGFTVSATPTGIDVIGLYDNREAGVYIEGSVQTSQTKAQVTRIHMLTGAIGTPGSTGIMAVQRHSDSGFTVGQDRLFSITANQGPPNTGSPRNFQVTSVSTILNAGDMPAAFSAARPVRNTQVAAGSIYGRRQYAYVFSGHATTSLVVLEVGQDSIIPLTVPGAAVPSNGGVASAVGGTVTAGALALHASRLWVGRGNSVRCSSAGQPSRWVASEGAIEFLVEGQVTCMVPMQGSEANKVLFIGTTRRVYLLYGTGAGPAPEFDWNLQPIGDTPGCLNAVYAEGDVFFWSASQGLMSLRQTQSFGNFASGVLGDEASEWLRPYMPTLTALGANYLKRTITAYFEDGQRAVFTLAGGKITGVMPERAVPTTAAVGPRRVHRAETLTVSGVPRYVECHGDVPVHRTGVAGFWAYPDRATAPLAIDAFVELAYSRQRMPNTRKHYRHAHIETASAPNFFEVLARASYENGVTQSSDQVLRRADGDTPEASTSMPQTRTASYVMDLDNHAENVSLRFSQSSQNWRPYVLDAVTLAYSVGRAVRA